MHEARARLALALDVPDLAEAEALAGRLAPWFGVAKIGVELATAAGCPRAVETMAALGFDVFCDLKLHDIPTTVERAARVVGSLGARYLTLHAAGGEAMVRAGAEAMREGALAAGYCAPVPLAVTVLTSDPDATAFDARLDVAVAAGCAGVVCSVHELDRVRARDASLVTVVPGIRPGGSSPDDQARAGTPAQAMAAGASLLVIGRAVTRAEDPEAAAFAIAEEVVRALDA